MDIQKYLLSKANFDLHQITFKLKTTPIIFFLNNVLYTISLFIPLIIKPTSSISNVSTNNSPQLLPKNNTSSSQEHK